MPTCFTLYSCRKLTWRLPLPPPPPPPPPPLLLLLLLLPLLLLLLLLWSRYTRQEELIAEDDAKGRHELMVEVQTRGEGTGPSAPPEKTLLAEQKKRWVPPKGEL
jgi:hypothetical protein